MYITSSNIQKYIIIMTFKKSFEVFIFLNFFLRVTPKYYIFLKKLKLRYNTLLVYIKIRIKFYLFSKRVINLMHNHSLKNITVYSYC